MHSSRLACAGAVFVLGIGAVSCGSSSGSPTTGPTPTPTPVAATPTPSPTPAGIVLPSGMTCSPTPPPLLRMQIKVLFDGERVVLDSSPLVANVDHYCDRVGFGEWKFCQTRPEGDAERTACDFLAVGKASDTLRWGPTWIGEGKPCGADFSQCANHPTNQFLAIAKGKGEFQACVAQNAPLAADGVRCTVYDYY